MAPRVVRNTKRSLRPRNCPARSSIRLPEGTDVGVARQLQADFAFDRAIRLGGIADDDDFPDARIDLPHQAQVGDDLLFLEHPGGTRRIQLLPDVVIVDPGKEHRHTGEHLVEVGQCEGQGIVVGDIDRRGPIPLILFPQMIADQVGISRTVARPLGIEVFDIERVGPRGILIQRLDEALVLTPGPGVFLAVGMEDENRCGDRRQCLDATRGQEQQQSKAHEFFMKRSSENYGYTQFFL